MGYDLHITRAEEWSQNEGREIAAAEWLALVSNDPELKLAPRNGPHSAVWRPIGGGDLGWIDC
jgi:hypothetical protein